MRALAALTLALALLIGCGGEAPPADTPPAPAPPMAAPSPAAIFAPFPYGAEDIRDATPLGRRCTFKVVDPNTETVTDMYFEAVDAQGTVVHTRVTTPDGAAVGERRDRSSWGDLQRHASYPVDFTTVTAVEVTVGAGTFQAKLYEVSDGQGGVDTRAWFADGLAGPPVKMEQYRGGELVMSMEMLSNVVEPPAAPQTQPTQG